MAFEFNKLKAEFKRISEAIFAEAKIANTQAQELNARAKQDFNSDAEVNTFNMGVRAYEQHVNSINAQNMRLGQLNQAIAKVGDTYKEGSKLVEVYDPLATAGEQTEEIQQPQPQQNNKTLIWLGLAVFAYIIIKRKK